jgi:hypothetical protein
MQRGNTAVRVCQRNDRVNIPAQEQGNASKMQGGEGGHGYPNRNSWVVSPS